MIKDETAAIVIAALFMNASFAIHYSPRLIGFDCEGSHGLPQFAKYESDFPKCARIEPIADIVKGF